MAQYIYTNKPNTPNLDGIHIETLASAMTDKSIEWCKWHEKTQTLEVNFTNSLSVEDKDVLDSIVTNNT